MKNNTDITFANKKSVRKFAKDKIVEIILKDKYKILKNEVVNIKEFKDYKDTISVPSKGPSMIARMLGR